MTNTGPKRKLISELESLGIEYAGESINAFRKEINWPGEIRWGDYTPNDQLRIVAMFKAKFLNQNPWYQSFLSNIAEFLSRLAHSTLDELDTDIERYLKESCINASNNQRRNGRGGFRSRTEKVSLYGRATSFNAPSSTNGSYYQAKPPMVYHPSIFN
jgi:hypothetical protein